MPLKNRYQKCSKISERKFREILKYFAQDLTASDTASLTGSRNVKNRLLLKELLNLMSHTSVLDELEVKEVEGLEVKLLFLASLSGTIKYIPKLSLMPQKHLLSR